MVKTECFWFNDDDELKHDDVFKWKHFPRNWPFVRGIHRSPVNSQWRGALMFSMICVWINGWVNNGEAGDLICHRAHYDVTVMIIKHPENTGKYWTEHMSRPDLYTKSVICAGYNCSCEPCTCIVWSTYGTRAVWKIQKSPMRGL